MQANWIGRSSGATLRFAIAAESEQAIEVFTTRPDTVFGVSYVVLAPEHALVDQLTSAEQREAVEAFRKSLQSISEQDRVAEDRPKRGVATGGRCNTRSPAKRCRFGSPTTCCRTTAPVP